MAKSRSKPRVIDLFSGAGGFSLGFHAAGGLIAAAVDAEKTAGQTLQNNFAHLQEGPHPRVRYGADGDMLKLSPDDILEGDQRPDIVIGGPPCQGFSRIGRGKLNSLRAREAAPRAKQSTLFSSDADGETLESAEAQAQISPHAFADDPRNVLYKRYLDAVKHWRPRALVMENVTGMLSVGGTNFANIVRAELAQLGYRVEYRVLNAAFFGVPQHRERLIFIGIRKDLKPNPVFPEPTHSALVPEGYLSSSTAPDQLSLLNPSSSKPQATSVREALDDLPRLYDHLEEGNKRPHGDFRRPMPYSGPATSKFARLMRQWPELPVVEEVQDQVIRRTPRDYLTFRAMAPGDKYAEALIIARQRFEDSLKRQRAQGQVLEEGSQDYEELKRQFVPPYSSKGYPTKWRKLIPDQPSWTVPAHLAKDTYSHIHYDGDQARAISIREAARLQSFPDGFQFTGNMGDCMRQIGNAVPPLLAWHIAATLFRSLNYDAVPPPL